MATQTQTATEPKSALTVEQKLQKMKELYADAPEVGKAALKNGLAMLTQELSATGRAQTAGRIGARQGKVSELTVFLPFVKGGAQRRPVSAGAGSRQPSTRCGPAAEQRL